MLQRSDRANAISASPTLTIDSKTKALVASGVDVVNLSVGEPDFPTPERASLAAIAAITSNFTKYTAVGGIVELRRGIAEKLWKDNQLQYDPDEIIVSSGAKQSLYNIFMTILNPGDEVILPLPYWVSYPEQIKLCGGVPIPVHTDESTGFKITPERLREAFSAKTKAVLINSPSNPTGAVYTPDEIRALARVIEEYPVYVVSDEIYEQLIYDVEHFSIARYSDTLRARTFVVNGFSKTHAMTGWRVGYVAGPRELVESMSSFQSHTTANPSSISQKAALGALGTFDLNTRHEFQQRRDYVLAQIEQLRGLSCSRPDGAFYIFPNAGSLVGASLRLNDGKRDKIDSVDHLCELLLSEAHVSVVPGAGFGAPDNFRISYATSMPNLQTAMQRISSFLARLN